MMRLVVTCLIMCVVFSLAGGTESDIGTVIGIDLGTTYSCVGVYKNGRVDIITNEQGNRITPSYVAFTANGERLIGDAAKNQLTTNPENTIFDAKRMIGRTWDDLAVQRDIKYWPFTVKQKNNKPHIEVSIKGTNKLFAPEEISAMVLGKMKEIAEDYLGHEVTHAVVTVPAYFSAAQRQATKDAGTIAGLNVIRILNEPTAAALAFGMDKKEDDQHIIVFDLGGGTFDVSLLTIDDNVFEVKATNGDTHLGGEDFDQRVMDYFIKLYQKKTGRDVRGDNRAMQKLRREVEKAKRSLSSKEQVRVDIESFFEGGDFSEPLSRARFEEENKDLFKSTLQPVQQVLNDTESLKTEIDEVVLVGGSTRIPKIQQLVKKFFDGKEPNLNINPDEAVAYGAAVLAGTLSKDDSADTVVLNDVIPLSLGIELKDGMMSRVISRNTVIPTKGSKKYTTQKDNQRVVNVKVFQGEREKTKDNSFLGNFLLEDITLAPRGVPYLNVTFEIDADGILDVTAKEERGTSTAGITISSKDRNKLSSKEIGRMIEDAERFAEEDRLAKEWVKCKNGLEKYAFKLKKEIKTTVGKVPGKDRKEIMELVEDVLKWLDTEADATVEECKQTKTNLVETANQVLRKHVEL